MSQRHSGRKVGVSVLRSMSQVSVWIGARGGACAEVCVSAWVGGGVVGLYVLMSVSRVSAWTGGRRGVCAEVYVSASLGECPC